ncbi:MAG: hypothetical protein ACW99U_21735 [Candidatus Thorarchaeota archaeon]|jgi:hypothetical protein
MTNTFYQWAIEETDEYGDVIDTEFHDGTFPGFPASPDYHVVLIRDQYKPHSGELTDRGWAYVRDGKLPTWFDSGHNVPKRFHKQVAIAS